MKNTLKEPMSRFDKVLFAVAGPIYAAIFLGWVLKGCGVWKGF